MAKPVRLAMVGLGWVGQGFLKLLLRKGDLVRTRYGLDLSIVAAADTSGAAVDGAGLDPQRLLQLKTDKQGAAAYPTAGRPGLDAITMVREVEADLLLQITPTNVRDGQPGLDCLRAALAKGMRVVTADKGPMVHAYQELVSQAQANGVGIAFSATVGGSLPTINIGQRDLIACTIEKLEGILNSTTNYILSSMAEGKDYHTALKEAQTAGIAEADPTLDVEGWDAANKLVILANAVLGMPAKLADVQVEGITLIRAGDLSRARFENKALRLLCTALRLGDTYRLTVRPEMLPMSHPLANVHGWQMGIVYHTDIMGVHFAAVNERGPLATAAAMLRDVVALESPQRRPGHG